MTSPKLTVARFAKFFFAILAGVFLMNFIVLPWTFPELQGSAKHALVGLVIGFGVYIAQIVFPDLNKREAAK